MFSENNDTSTKKGLFPENGKNKIFIENEHILLRISTIHKAQKLGLPSHNSDNCLLHGSKWREKRPNSRMKNFIYQQKIAAPLMRMINEWTGLKLSKKAYL